MRISCNGKMSCVLPCLCDRFTQAVLFSHPGAGLVTGSRGRRGRSRRAPPIRAKGGTVLSIDDSPTLIPHVTDDDLPCWLTLLQEYSASKAVSRASRYDRVLPSTTIWNFAPLSLLSIAKSHLIRDRHGSERPFPAPSLRNIQVSMRVASSLCSFALRSLSGRGRQLPPMTLRCRPGPQSKPIDR
jgi:hypothetical protein